MIRSRALPLLIISAIILGGCGEPPKASYRACFDCHHKEKRCPRLTPPVRSECDVEIIFPAGTGIDGVDAYRKKALASSEVKSIELIPSEEAASRFKEKSPSLELKLFRGASPDALVTRLALGKEQQLNLRIPLAAELKKCTECHKQEGRYDVHEVHAKAKKACDTCHIAASAD